MGKADIFYGKDIPKIFPKPDYWCEMKGIEPEEIYTIDEFNYQNNSISFKKCSWLK
jgi:hypothetical protein